MAGILATLEGFLESFWTQVIAALISIFGLIVPALREKAQRQRR